MSKTPVPPPTIMEEQLRAALIKSESVVRSLTTDLHRANAAADPTSGGRAMLHFHYLTCDKCGAAEVLDADGPEPTQEELEAHLA